MPRISWILAGGALFAVGWLAGQLQPSDAYAQSPAPAPLPTEPSSGPTGPQQPASAPRPPQAPSSAALPAKVYCKPFQVPLEGGRAAVDTGDATTELGAWIASLEASYTFDSIDFEIGQKNTGYPVGYAFVCLAPLLK